MAEQRTVAVIGGGVIGVSCALMLAREGHRVTVVEKGRIGHGCSWGNGAQYTAGSSFPMAHPGVLWRALRWLADTDGPVRLAPRELPRTLPWLVRFLRTGRPNAWETAYAALHALHAPCAELYRDMLGDVEWKRVFRPNGALHVWRDVSLGPLDGVVDGLRAAHGVAFERLNAEELRRLEPGLARDYQRGIFFPGGGHVTSPLALVESLMGRAGALGVAIRTARVLAIEPGIDGVTLQTNTGRHRCDIVVIAAGIASRDLARSLGISLSLVSERGYHVTVPGISSVISRPVTDAASAFVATPLEEGLRIVGIAEFDAPDAPRNPKQSSKLQACARAMLPDILISQVTDWMGVRPSTPDSLPIIGPHPKHAAILFATGHGHMGISGAPMTAAIVCDLVAGRAPRLSCAPYRVR
ncbi:FAD-binding oxidoreductase [Mesorhizobium sp. M1A.F.Ca.IN.020.03.2.1]|uniref:NAD(P)/FAD-dependent oxidoreductase n=1 Tax=unclassified Mesorhizobium TaxID=325217 RepID=UPI000FCA55AE|nr:MULTISPECIES: FAD-binding oxidoreductase [unclassified Mesorhizobium]RUV08351.1 FAD-binding oxidoreductase [Mesorhizobium sp. M1A.F.Ca.IN.020.03.2.1]RUV26081.1 FAD-binding oxidoreductase [Mesorhizobium sp. M1A.F.Ca.IN.022.04.1.1]RWB32779.1 MAG: FAD-binding oxidoreductase [Mesorhizobium sp.]RWD10762.1 MAG: FAD-binding oxidoreductase [Mesorhizobium sp.]RWE66986.1 MAG: FAD-binding oxidoreductase [Mesorhizobium sp.]